MKQRRKLREKKEGQNARRNIWVDMDIMSSQKKKGERDSQSGQRENPQLHHRKKEEQRLRRETGIHDYSTEKRASTDQSETEGR